MLDVRSQQLLFVKASVLFPTLRANANREPLDFCHRQLRIGNGIENGKAKTWRFVDARDEWRQVIG
jgi:hypothetical protein